MLKGRQFLILSKKKLSRRSESIGLSSDLFLKAFFCAISCIFAIFQLSASEMKLSPQDLLANDPLPSHLQASTHVSAPAAISESGNETTRRSIGSVYSGRIDAKTANGNNIAAIAAFLIVKKSQTPSRNNIVPAAPAARITNSIRGNPSS